MEAKEEFRNYDDLYNEVDEFDWSLVPEYITKVWTPDNE